ncbi:MAG: HNH endonuclease [Candidatus Saccharibacteria bacterium]|nr:HNH endonuclease [Candidatus Saccharibacteria bacterium]
MKFDSQKTIEQLVDYLMPELTPYEVAMYILLFRNTYLRSAKSEIRIGKRTIADLYGKGSRGEKTNYAHVTKLVKGLQSKDCIHIGDTNRDGTLYTIFLPSEIPLVKEKLSITADPAEEDYYTDPEKRKEILERDNYTCHYCGEKVTEDNATLDHLFPQHKGGKHGKDNLKTSCLICNSIKSGKTYEEAAPHLLKSIQDRRQKQVDRTKSGK